MIDIELIKSIKTIVTHDACADGMASALILHDCLPDAEIKFVQYKSKELLELEAKPGILFCDMTPPLHRFEEFIAAKAIVLDHHEGASSITREFERQGLGVYADEPGVSGAVLAYREVWDVLQDSSFRRSVIVDLARKAGIRDTWQTKHQLWDASYAQAAALLFWPRDLWLDVSVSQWSSLLASGPILIQKRLAEIRKAMETSYHFKERGVRVVMFQGAELSSDVADYVGDDADLVVGFDVSCKDGDNKLWTRYSCRSHTGFDCMALAQRYGGNGHRAASGFFYETSNPVSEFEVLFMGYIVNK